MRQVPMVFEHTNRCLRCARWFRNPVLMVIDAAFDSIGLNYIQSVVPKVELFRQQYVESGKINSFAELAEADIDQLRCVWKNARSWLVARDMAKYLSDSGRKLHMDDRRALMNWAGQAPLHGWQQDPIGHINGVGIVTYQYLRMMGGIDTVMPDKIVKRIIIEMLEKAGVKCPEDDIQFVLFVEEIAPETGYKAIEICWMTWLIQSEAWVSSQSKYATLLDRI
jgi:hypothetical protein